MRTEQEIQRAIATLNSFAKMESNMTEDMRQKLLSMEGALRWCIECEEECFQGQFAEIIDRAELVLTRRGVVRR